MRKNSMLSCSLRRRSAVDKGFAGRLRGVLGADALVGVRRVVGVEWWLLRDVVGMLCEAVGVLRDGVRMVGVDALVGVRGVGLWWLLRGVVGMLGLLCGAAGVVALLRAAVCGADAFAEPCVVACEGGGVAVRSARRLRNNSRLSRVGERVGGR